MAYQNLRARQLPLSLLLCLAPAAAFAADAPETAEAPSATETAAEAGFPDRFPENIGDLFQETVSCRGAECIVIKFEIFDIGADDAISLVGVFQKFFLSLLKKVLFTVQSRKSVVSELIDRSGGLAEVDKIFDTVTDNLRAIGLSNKVRCAVSQCRNLDFFARVGSKYYDRNGGKFVVMSYFIQKRVTVHNRHNDVQ